MVLRKLNKLVKKNPFITAILTTAFSGFAFFIIKNIQEDDTRQSQQEQQKQSGDGSISVQIQDVPGKVDVNLHSNNQTNRNDVNEASLKEFIAVLKQRAEKIEQWFIDQPKTVNTCYENQLSYEEVIKEFRRLHENHIEALENKQLILAHEILVDIHKLLSNYDTHDYETPYSQYSKHISLYPGRLYLEEISSTLKELNPDTKDKVLESLDTEDKILESIEEKWMLKNDCLYNLP